MNKRSTAVLAERLALAIVTHGPSSGSDLARKVGAIKAAALHVLRTNSIFARVGHGRASKYGLAVPAGRSEPLGTDAEPLSGRAGHNPDSHLTDDLRETLAAFSMRLDAIERLLGLEPARTNGDVPPSRETTIEDASAGEALA